MATERQAGARAAPGVLVLGSLHMDLIARAERLPGRGQSVAGGTFQMAPGGKAGNQAAALARAGLATRLMTRLGRDGFGDTLAAAMAATGVDVALVSRHPTEATGASTVMVAEGDYASIIAPGAAATLTPFDMQAAAEAIAAADALVLQLELPVEVSAEAARIAAAAGRAVVLNAAPAPAAPLPAAFLSAVTLLVVNLHEAGVLAGQQGAPETLAGILAAPGRAVLLTLGAEGSLLLEAGVLTRQPAYAVRPVDTVGAGDAFLGAYLAARLHGEAATGALRRGAAAGAIAVSRAGALPALPDRAEVDAFLARAAPPQGPVAH